MRAPAESDGGPSRWQQRRKNPLPVVCDVQGNDLSLLAYGEPHDPCPVAGCRGTLLFLHR
jgi:hypothetical protein